MRIFFDEDTGGGVPRALRAVDIKDVEFPNNKKGARIRLGAPDEEWIPFAGRNGYLVFSCNKAILEAEAQLRLLIQERVGAVFLTTGQARKLDVLKLVLKRWDWLEQIDATDRRPFAYRISIRGHRAPVDIAQRLSAMSETTP